VIVMTLRTPALLRWSEEAEAEQVCSLAVLEPEPLYISFRAVAGAAAPNLSFVARPALWPRLLDWLAYSRP
jgi:hypothetical protein